MKLCLCNSGFLVGIVRSGGITLAQHRNLVWYGYTAHVQCCSILKSQLRYHVMRIQWIFRCKIGEREQLVNNINETLKKRGWLWIQFKWWNCASKRRGWSWIQLKWWKRLMKLCMPRFKRTYIYIYIYNFSLEWF